MFEAWWGGGSRWMDRQVDRQDTSFLHLNWLSISNSVSCFFLYFFVQDSQEIHSCSTGRQPFETTALLLHLFLALSRITPSEVSAHPFFSASWYFFFFFLHLIFFYFIFHLFLCYLSFFDNFLTNLNNMIQNKIEYKSLRKPYMSTNSSLQHWLKAKKVYNANLW